MAVKLNSEIYLVKNIKMDRNYINVLSYSENQMLDLCRQNQVAYASDYSFIRPQNSIFTNFTYEQCLQANYIAFQNKDYSNKWFFAFIDEVIYKGEKNTEITYKIDSWITWFDYWQKQPCFISRQHVNNDGIGVNTEPENLDIGEIFAQSYDIYSGLGSDYYYMVMSTYDPALNRDFTGVVKINGTLFGQNIFTFDSSNTGVISLMHFLQDINQDGKIEGVLNLFIAPKTLIDNIGKREQTGTYEGATYNYYIIDTDSYINSSSGDDAIEIPFIIDRTTNFTDYTPKNNKCFVYPYNYLLVTNNVGNQIIYKYEDFFLNGVQATNVSFAVQIALSVGVSCRLVPRGYRNVDYNYDETIPLAKYPTCSWASDAYTNWLTDNAINIATQIGSTAVGVATGNVPTVAGNIASLIGQFYSASLMPSITGGNNTGDVNFSSKSNTFNFYHMRCKTEYLRIIDDYFSRFGYKLNRLETPNIVGRRNWNYVEIGANECIGYGSVPTKYMEEINNACRKGVTIWHNHSNLGNYNLDNSIT